MSITADPAFAVYALTASFVSVHMALLDAFSGLVRGRTKTTPNTEDARLVSRGAKVVPEDPDEVARVMRAHRNLIANGVPFLILGLVWVLLGADKTWATAIFGTFAGARVLHSIAYVGKAQPWRTLAFVVGQIALAAVVVQVVRGAVAVM